MLPPIVFPLFLHTLLVDSISGSTQAGLCEVCVAKRHERTLDHGLAGGGRKIELEKSDPIPKLQMKHAKIQVSNALSLYLLLDVVKSWKFIESLAVQ